MTTLNPGAGAPEQPTPHTIDRLIDTIKATVPADTIAEANRLADTLETAYANLADTLDRATHIAAQAEETARQITHGLATPADGILDILDDITGVGKLATALAALEHAATGPETALLRQLLRLDPVADDDARTVAEVAHDLGITVDDIAEIYTGTDPAITAVWFAALDDGTGIGTGNPTPFAEQTLTPIGRQDIVAHVQSVAAADNSPERGER